MKKKVLSLLLALLVIVGSIPLTLLSAAAEEIGNIADDVSPEEPDKPVVSIEPTERYNTSVAPAKPDASGYAHFIIKATGEITEDITVNYSTEDISAIAVAGDYEAASGSVVLTKANPKVEISVKTARAEYSITVNLDDGRSRIDRYNYVSRSFKVKLTDVSENALLSNDRREIECALLAEHNLEAYEFKNATVLAPYTSAGNYDLGNVLTTDPCDGGESYRKKVPVNFPASWSADYVGTGVGAQLYMALRNAHIDESSYNSSSEVQVSIAGVGVLLKGEFHNNADFGWGPYLLYANNKVSGNEDRYKKYTNNNYQYTHWTTYDEDYLFLNDTDYLKNIFAAKIITRRDYWSYGEPSSNPKDPGEYYIGLHRSMLKQKEIEIFLESYGGYDRRLTGGSITFRLEDATAPKIATNESGAYKIYHNFDTVKKGEKLRVAIRFNEPVQVNGQNPVFVGKVNGVGTGIEPHPYAIKFTYVGGSGTDTLYFESDFQSNYQINSITDIQFKYADSIKDFGGVANSFSAVSDIVLSGFNMDRRIPHISIDSSDVKTDKYVNSKSIEVTVSNISDHATLYYSWTATKDEKPAFENSIALNSVSVNGTQSVTILGEGNGIKYLHIKVETKYGQVKDKVAVSGVAEEKSVLGPYKFDNAAPTIEDESKLLPVSAASDLKVKTYSIPVPKDNSSKNIELKMYVIWEDGTEDDGTEDDGEILPWKTYTFTENDSKPYEIKLTAADVGIDDDYTRRVVTVYFTLTDEIGNTSANLGSHRTVFDTCEYIKVGNAGSADGYKKNTDDFDEGYTFVYDGDVQSNPGSICYSFVFEDVKPPELQDPNDVLWVKVTKNGAMLTESVSPPYFSEMDENGMFDITIHFYAPLGEGYYDLQLEYFIGGAPTSVGEKAPDYVSEIFRVYLGSGNGDLDERIEHGTVLSNKVYQLPSSSYFYYMDTDGTVGTVLREAYNKTTLPASFSSQIKAFEYVLFNEYRDLYAVTLTDELAEALNAGNSNVRKALGETKTAEAGQVWVRYKRASWDVSKTPISSDWVFYYYGTTEILHVKRLPKLLEDALASVAASITSRGSTVVLTDFSLATVGSSGGSLLDSLGAPYLAPAQLHTENKRLSEEKCNAKFIVEVTFAADTAIYSSHVLIKDTQYVLIGNEVIPEGSRFQYKRIDESGKEDENWTDITFKKDQRFRDVMTMSGRYKLRELGKGGASVFNVYIDGDAPMVVVSWKDKDGNTKSQMLNKSSEKNFRAKSFRIIGIDSAEYDKYSYVALYNATNEKLYGVYTLSDLQAASVDIPDGNYYMIVADRSGNSYTMTLYLNSSQLYCPITVSENVKIKFTCDRKESQIEEFYVKRNGVFVSGKYASELEFTESGTYEFYVRDIYGNVFGPEIHVFNRVYPEVTWKYRNESGHYVTYDPENKTKYFTLDSVLDGTYTMSTSVGLKFQISDSYGFTFLGVAPEHSQNLNDGTVTIKTTQAFQLKVYYKKHPEVYTIYTCSADTVAPVVEASVQVEQFVPDEIEEMRQSIASGAVFEVGSKLTPPKISYSSVASNTRYLANGDTVLADFIKITVYDESGLAHVRVYRNGTLEKEQSGENAASDIVLSKSGKYRVVAEDALGNTSEFTFTNGTPNSFTYVVDGLPITIGLHDNEKFDRDGNYTDSTFGCESMSLIISEPMKVFYKISDSYGNARFVAFDVSGKVVREVYYTVDGENNIFLQSSSEPLFNGNDSKIAEGKEYVLYELKDIGVKIYATLNSNGTINLTVYASTDPCLIVEARLNTEKGEFYYAKTELSIHAPNLVLITDGVMDIAPTKELIKLNRSFTISKNNFADKKITSVEVYHSMANDFDGFGFLFMDDLYKDGAYYGEEGFYFVRLVNEYGNESAFIIHISYKFDVTAYTEYADGQVTHYSSSYTDMLYSNNKIVFEIYANGVTAHVQRFGIDYQPVIVIENGITYVILSQPGSYTVTLTDMHRNSLERSAEISFLDIGFIDDLLTGYNENALKKDEGYTNRKLSVNKSVLESERICYLAIQYGDTVEVVFDSVSEKSIALDEGKLKEIIGSYGDGEYTVIARNRYGAVLSKVIHYRSTPTLILEREIRSGTEPEVYDVEKALSIGFWSNSELIFKTEAEYYEFTINGDRTECPKTLSFASAEQQGHSEYDITYVDEYGFTYSFKAHLVRQELEIVPNLGSEPLNIDGVLTTTEDIAIRFSENAYCTYTLNNSEEKIYTPEQKLTMDGIYRFVVVDHAGNMSALTIKKDTIVEFEFIESNSSAAVLSGGVVNYSKVEFKPVNGDTVRLEKVFKNGVLQSDFDSTKFAEDGKWEFIVSDKLGNKSYFCFYIITKQKSGFAYTTPYEYSVTELWYDSGDGVKISYLKFVNHNETSSSFEFVENGKYTVVMTSGVTGSVSRFEFSINTNAPAVSLVGCQPGANTINDVTITGCIVGDTVKVYRATQTGEQLVKEIEVTSLSTKMPTINEGGEYRIVVESEAGVATELSFVRKHVMNIEGSIFIMIIIAVAVIGLFVGLVYRNKSKTDK